jgi:hypothetical protein
MRHHEAKDGYFSYFTVYASTVHLPIGVFVVVLFDDVTTIERRTDPQGLTGTVGNIASVTIFLKLHRFLSLGGDANLIHITTSEDHHMHLCIDLR